MCFSYGNRCAAILSKTDWYELENRKTIKNKIIDPIWKVKIYDGGTQIKTK